MAEKTVHNEGADIVYEQVGAGPMLLMIAGAGGTGDGYQKAAQLLSDSYTVVTYDRRCNGRSSGDRTRDLEMAQQAHDAVVIIAAAGFDKSFVFGNSGGANIALKLAEDHPGVVAGLIVHEPPVVAILPDADVWLNFVDEVRTTFETKGPRRAMLRFVRSTVGVNPVKLVLSRGTRKPDFRFFLEREYVPITTYNPDVDELRNHGVPLIALAGKDSKDAYYARTAPILAERAGGHFLTISGNHFAFQLSPDTFVKELRAQLSTLPA